MKSSKTLPLLAALLGPVILLTGPASAAPPAPAAPPENLTQVYEAGRQAFNKGDYRTAKTAFAKVLKAKPDFDLALIYMAQIRTAEAKWEARPRSQKLAEKSSIASVTLTKVTLADALEVVRRELEKAGGGPQAGAIQLITDLPNEALERPMDLTVKNLPMKEFIDAVAYAGNVRISWHDQGLSVTNAPDSDAKPDPEVVAATRRMQQIAQTKILPLIKLENATPASALAWLRTQVDTAQGPLIISREPLPNVPVTMELRQVPLSEAIRSVAIIAGMEVTWHPWGAGLSAKPEVAGNTAVPRSAP